MFRLSLIVCCLGCCALSALPQASSADTPVFSGPQVGEKLPPMKAAGAIGDLADKTFDPVEMADGKPTLLIFLHQKTRPAFGLIRAITDYAVTRQDKGLQTSMIYLDNDKTEAVKWLAQIQRMLNKKATYGVSVDGVEGPGAYGLNRNVQVTILVADEGKVTANFAIVSPQLQADGPAILKAIVEVTGGGEVPTIESLTEGSRMMMRRRQGQNERRQNAQESKEDE